MRYILIIFIISNLNSYTLKEIFKYIDKTPAIDSANMILKASKERYLSTKGMNIPSIDIEFKAMHLKDTPTMSLHFPNFPISNIPRATKDNFEAEISISYPIFTGFAISSQINKSYLQTQKAKLQQKDLKRNLYLKAVKLFGSIKMINSFIKAEKEAKLATQKALKKAQGFYKQGLIALSELYNIKAKLYETDAILAQSISKKEQLLNSLSYLINRKITKVEGPFDINIPPQKKLKTLAHKYRSDILVLKKILDINDEDIKMAKSPLYPKVYLKASFKRHGDTLSLNGDGYTNADNSYVALDIKYNIYNGGSDIHNIEATRYIKLSNNSKLIDYIHKVDAQIDNAYSKLKSLRYRLKSANMQLKAQKSYYKLILGRFENQLSSADELSRAIASLADAKAQKASIIYSIKIQKYIINLLGELNI